MKSGKQSNCIKLHDSDRNISKNCRRSKTLGCLIKNHTILQSSSHWQFCCGFACRLAACARHRGTWPDSMENATNVTTVEVGAGGGGEGDNLRQLYEFLIKGVLLGVVSLLGILGNVLTMVILSRPQMRSSINCLLVGLARCDAALLAAAILIFSLPCVTEYTGCLPQYNLYVYPFIARVTHKFIQLIIKCNFSLTTVKSL